MYFWTEEVFCSKKYSAVSLLVQDILLLAVSKVICGITFYRAIEQLCSKGQQTVSFIAAKPKTL